MTPVKTVASTSTHSIHMGVSLVSAMDIALNAPQPVGLQLTIWCQKSK